MLTSTIASSPAKLWHASRHPKLNRDRMRLRHPVAFLSAFRTAPGEEMAAEHSHRRLTRLVAFLALTAAYLYGYPSATITYAAVDLLHIAVGAVLTLLLLGYFFRVVRIEATLARVGWLFLAAGAF